MIQGAADDDVSIAIEESAVDELLAVTPADVDPPAELTFARNVFVPLTTACRYTCTYCTYFDPPGEASLLSLEDVREICRRGAAAGCTEALFTFGDDPDDRYTEIHTRLASWGFDSIHEYLRAACLVALEEGLLPHANPGDQTRTQMATVADVNASMGVMLETTADVGAHAGPRRKEPAQRLATIRTAGELAVPFTTGILVGIGEDWVDRAESLLAIRELNERYGHVQEVIVQPVRDNDRWGGGTPDRETMRRVTAMARVALPESVSVQVPPNLTPVRELIDCGVDDLGGVSPVTDDHVNPDYAWPALGELTAIADDVGLALRERLPVYARYLPEDLRGGGLRGDAVDGRTTEDDAPADPVDPGREWISPRIREAITAENPSGRRYRDVLRGRVSVE